MQNKLAWWEPKWSYRPAVRKEATRLVRAISTVLTITAAIVLFLICLCNHYLPGLEFNWLRAVAIGAGLMAGYLGLFLAFHWFVPPRVGITAKRVSFLNGSHGVQWRLDDIHSARVTEVGPEQRVLVIQNVAGRERQCGLPQHVSLGELQERFGARWNAAPLPPNTANKEFVAAMGRWPIVMSVFMLVLVLVQVVAGIMGVSRAVFDIIMRALTAVGGAMAVIFFIKAYRFDRAHRAAHKKLGLPEK